MVAVHERERVPAGDEGREGLEDDAVARDDGAQLEAPVVGRVAEPVRALLSLASVASSAASA